MQLIKASRGGIISEEHPVTLSRGLRQERVLVRFYFVVRNSVSHVFLHIFAAFSLPSSFSAIELIVNFSKNS
jgi:hypothetical protein